MYIDTDSAHDAEWIDIVRALAITTDWRNNTRISKKNTSIVEKKVLTHNAQYRRPESTNNASIFSDGVREFRPRVK
jgi:hypothetical protein